MPPVGTCCEVAPSQQITPSSLFEEHLEWAASIGRSVGRGLPPSFDDDDLEQLARIAHWRRCELYDPTTGAPYRAYAYFAIRGAVLMGCRRRHYREATHDELKGEHVDKQLRPDELLLAGEEQTRLAGSQTYRRVRVLMALETLLGEDADLVRRVLVGRDVVEMEPDERRRLSRAVAKLRHTFAKRQF